MSLAGSEHGGWLQGSFEWLGHSWLGETIRNSPVLFPSVEIAHLLGLTLFFGTLLMVDLNLLGIGMKRQPVSRIAGSLMPFTTAGLIVLLVTGPLLLAAEAEKMSMNPLFPYKMVILAGALVFHFTAYRSTASKEDVMAPRHPKLVGAISLLLWGFTSLIAKIMNYY